MEWKILPDGRSCLPEGTILKFDGDRCYRILGSPVGYGGAGILYPSVRVVRTDGGWRQDEFQVVLKECYPAAEDNAVRRQEDGSVCAAAGAKLYDCAVRMMLTEKEVTARIFRKGFRLTPVWEIVQEEEISLDGERFAPARNCYAVMERLDEKGVSLGKILTAGRGADLTAYESICIIVQVLQALEEVHEAGYLHGDIQENNIFLKGGGADKGGPGIVSLIDFGSARALLEDGATDCIAPGELYSTRGYSAPECTEKGSGPLRLTRAADLYSVGYLLLRMLLGKTVEPGALKLAVNGKYLYPRRARKIGCPSGSIEAVNRFLQKALQQDSGERFQSSGEMLTEADRLKTALSPPKSAIASVDYDAFISYCHEETSIHAAELIQKKMERYRIPPEIQKHCGKKRLKKIFRDREELASSADMEGHLREALRHSSFLIVLLSPGVPDSEWVNREIGMFLETHDREHILTVLVEGEPQEVLPDSLKEGEKYISSSSREGRMSRVSVEGLAADIRGKDPGEQKKKLKTEIFRLLAPILGCSFDDLRRRQREYRVRRTLRFMTAALLCLAVITGYISWQALQIQKNHWQAMIQRSRYLAKESGELLSSGDRIKALLVAMEAFPEGEKDDSRPRTAEAEAALVNALYAYRAIQTPAQYLDAVRLMRMDSRSSGGEVLSPDGSRLLSHDSGGVMYLWDQDGLKLHSWDSSFWAEHSVEGDILFCDFMDDQTILFLTEHVIGRLSIEEENVEIIKEITGDLTSTRQMSCALSGDGKLLAVYTPWSTDYRTEIFSNCSLKIYSAETGEAVYSAGVNAAAFENGMAIPECSGLCFSPGGRYLAVPVYDSYSLSDTEQKASLGILAIADLKEKKTEYVKSTDVGYYQACFTDEEHLILFGFSLSPGMNYYEEKTRGKIACRELKSGKSIWEKELEIQMRNGKSSGILPAGDSVLVWYNREGIFLDPLRGETQMDFVCQEGMAGIALLKDDAPGGPYLVAAENGNMYILDKEEGTLQRMGTNIQREVKGFLYMNKETGQYAYLISPDEGTILVLENRGDLSADVLSLDGKLYWLDMDVGSPYYVTVTGSDSGTETVLSVYDKSSHARIAVIPVKEGLFFNRCCWLSEQVLCFADSEHDGSGGTLTAYDLEKQEVVWKTALSLEFLYNVSFYQMDNAVGIFTRSEREIYFLDAGSGELVETLSMPENESGDRARIEELQVSADGRYLALLLKEGPLGDDTVKKPAVYDREMKCWSSLPPEFADLKFSSVSSTNHCFFMDEERNRAAVYDETERRMLIWDLGADSISFSLPFEGRQQRQALFLPDGNRMVLWGDDGFLQLWDMEGECILMKDQRRLYYLDRLCFSKETGIFWTQGYDELEYRTRGNQSLFQSVNLMYLLDSDGKFYPYARVYKSVYDPWSDSIVSFLGNTLYWYSRYTLDELLDRAAAAAAGETLSEADRAKYYID